MGVAGQHHAPADLPRGNTRYPLYRRLGRPQGRSVRMRKISPPPPGIRNPDRPGRSESLYRLSYRGRHNFLVGVSKFIKHALHPPAAPRLAAQSEDANLSSDLRIETFPRRISNTTDGRPVRNRARMYLLTYLLTAWSRVLLEKPTGFAANQEIPRIF